MYKRERVDKLKTALENLILSSRYLTSIPLHK